MIVQEAKSEDMEGIVHVLKSVRLQDEAWATGAVQKLLKTPDYVILVAKLDGKVVGFVDYHVLPSLWEKWNEAIINNLFVHKDHQNKGVGSKLLKEALKQLDKKGIVEVSIVTDKEDEIAVHLYKKHGFTKEYLMLERRKEQLPQRRIV